MRRGVTLIELLVVMVVLALLAGLLLPAIALARDAAQRVTCSAQLRQVGMASLAYLDDWDGRYGNFSNVIKRGTQGWRAQLSAYLNDDRQNSRRAKVGIWTCPADGTVHGDAAWHNALSYGGNRDLSNLHQARIERPSDTVLCVDSTFRNGNHSWPAQWKAFDRYIDWRHRSDANLLFVDAHVESRARSAYDLPTYRAMWRQW